MNSRTILLIAFILLGTGSVYAQKNSFTELKIRKKEFKTADEEGLKAAWFNLQEGDRYFEKGRGTYPQARDYYLLAHQYNSDHPVLNFKIGLCYLFTDDKYEAIKYLRKAFDQAPKLHPDMNFYLARANHLVLEFDKAIEFYKKHRDYLVETGQADKVDAIDKYIAECGHGKNIVAGPVRVIITNLGDSINSAWDDYLPLLTQNDSVMVFTSRRSTGARDKRNPYDNLFYEDIYRSEVDGNNWTGAEFLQKNLLSPGNDAAVGFSPMGDQLFIYRGGKNGGDLYVSKFNAKKGKWKSPGPMPGKFNSKQAEGSIFFTTTGDTAYFISANEELTNGGKDIFIAIKNSKGKWMDPRNLGSIINTSYDEEGLYITPSGEEIYFSSKGHNSMGGFDVFHSIKQNDGTWSDPRNLGYPVNTPDDEIFYSLSRDGKHAYYTANREGGKGARDIYKLVFLGSEKELLLHSEDDLIAGLDDLAKKGFFTTPEPFAIDSFLYLTGRVLDSKTNEPVLAKMQFIDLEKSEITATAVTTETGDYRVKFSSPQQYGIEIVAKDYLFFLDVIDMRNAVSEEPVVRDFLLDKVEVGTKVVLENIYFETNKATLKPDSYKQLNQVVEFLKSNPSIRLEISGHTDNVGSLKVNTKLSEDRAKSVVDYLVAAGIEAARLESKGYAFTQPVAPNDTVEGREKNRRVEFKVLSK